MKESSVISDTVPPAEEQQPENQDPLRAFGAVFRQQLDQAIKPVVAHIRQQQPFALDHSRDEASVPSASSQPSGQTESTESEEQKGPSSEQALLLSVDHAQAENALQTGLDAVLDTLFSETAQESFRDRMKQAVQSMVASGRRLAPEDESFSVEPEQFTEQVDLLVDVSFSNLIRENARDAGKKAIRGLLGWDAPSVQQAGAVLISDMVERRLAAVEAFWRHVLVTMLEAERDLFEAANSGETEDSEPTSQNSITTGDLPQTLARSERRAQEIWVKARDKAAEKDGPGVRAERAGYDALKKQYERKGDRWVEKPDQDSDSDKGASDDAGDNSSETSTKTKG